MAFENGQGINKQPCLKMKVGSQVFWHQLWVHFTERACVRLFTISTVEALFLTNAGLEVVWLVEQ